MTQDNDNSAAVTQDESNSDSPVIQQLRQQVKQLTDQVKAQPDRAAIEAEIRSELKRNQAIEIELTNLGHPAGMTGTVAGQLGESEVSRETVADALRAIGYTIQDESDGGSGDDGDAVDQGDLATVTDLSRQVSSAASGTQTPSVEQQIAGAKSREELAAIMGGIEGATADYTTL